MGAGPQDGKGAKGAWEARPEALQRRKSLRRDLKQRNADTQALSPKTRIEVGHPFRKMMFICDWIGTHALIFWSRIKCPSWRQAAVDVDLGWKMT